MKIYTKKGDLGETSLFGGERVLKNHIRIDAYGTIDELNSYIGLIRDQDIHISIKAFLTHTQEVLFTVGSHLAASKASALKHLPKLNPDEIKNLEMNIDAMETELAPLTSFILPGGHTIVSYCHIARCVCRRAERYAVTLNEHESIETFIIQYLNRLSDYLFVLSRKVAKDLQVEEIKWIPKKG